MARMNCAKYRNEKNSINAITVDDNYDSYSEDDRKHFRCPFCNVQLQFSRGKSHSDPHFKNWPLKEHEKGCSISKAINQLRWKKNEIELETLVSTILPRAMRISDLNSSTNEPHENNEKKYGGKQTQKFLYDIRKILDPHKKFDILEEYKELKLLTEDNKEVYIKDIILTQDEIIDVLDSNENKSFVCILKATVSNIKELKGSYIYNMTKSEKGTYGNTKDFKLYMHYDFVQKNKKIINSIKKSLIICYGIASNTDYGYQMDLYAIKNQVAVLMSFNELKKF